MPISRAMINKELRKKGGTVKDKDWIKDAVKRPGALRKKLGVAKGKKISASQLNKAANSSNATTRRQAKLANTFKKMNRRSV